MSRERVILHADMDAFFAAVEQLDDPELRGKPVLVGGTGDRGVVSTASYEARPFKVGSAMPMAVARRRCPQAIVVAPRFERYSEISRKVQDIFHRFSPLVEPLSLDEAFLDLTGTRALLGDGEHVARRIKESVRAETGLTISVGVAPCKYVAKVASDHRKPDGLVVVREPEVLEFLAPLSVSKLWGVGPKTAPILEAMGLRTIGDVAAASPDVLEARLGSLGRHIAGLARGDDPREVVPDREAKSVGWERTLEKDVIGAEVIRPHLRRAADEVSRRLRAERLAARGARLKLKTGDFFLHTRQCKLARATDASDDLYEAVCRLLLEVGQTMPVRLIGLAAFDLEAKTQQAQGELFGGQERRRRSGLDEALDAIGERFGHGVVKRGSDPFAFGDGEGKE